LWNVPRAHNSIAWGVKPQEYPNQKRALKEPNSQKKVSIVTTTILEKIIAFTRELVERRKSYCSEQQMMLRAHSLPGTRDFRAALADHSDDIPNIIAEIKKASPSKGLIRENFRPVALARELAANGAAALSVLTEPEFFQGGIRNLRMAHDNVAIPVLRKDFIVTEYQLYEARVFGADAVLLIAAALNDEELKHLYRIATDLGLEVLLEVHDIEELERALAIDPVIVGVNARDLKTFKVSLETTENLMANIPDGIVKVAESGIHTQADIRRLQDAGADAFLIGESIMRKASPGAALQKLL
jgi:indole-3-glycerol phosphate synthase